jgi:hypothetical protein
MANYYNLTIALTRGGTLERRVGALNIHEHVEKISKAGMWEGQVFYPPHSLQWIYYVPAEPAVKESPPHD